MKIEIITALTGLLLTTAAAAQDDWRADVAARLPETGALNLRLFNEGEEDGFMRLGWRRNGERIELFDRTMMVSSDVFESMTAAMTADDFAPLDTLILWHQETAILTVETMAEDGRATGTRSVLRPMQGEEVSPLELDLPAGVMPRAATFVFAPFLDLAPGESITYDWYAVLPNTVASVTVTAFDGGPVETPAGRYEETLRLEVRGTTPEDQIPLNDIYVTGGEVVRIDVVGRDMIFLRRADVE